MYNNIIYKRNRAKNVGEPFLQKMASLSQSAFQNHIFYIRKTVQKPKIKVGVIMDNDFLLIDRVQKVRQIIKKYGENSFFISYSGGLDSNVLHTLVDLALPNNHIPRVYCDTGIEMLSVRSFVKELMKADDRIEIIKPGKNVKKMLEEEGYPFKSKQHSMFVGMYQNKGEATGCVKHYLGIEKQWSTRRTCPKILRYQFENPDSIPFKVSDKCCKRLKVDPLHKWQRERSTLRYTWFST